MNFEPPELTEEILMDVSGMNVVECSWILIMIAKLINAGRNVENFN